MGGGGVETLMKDRVDMTSSGKSLTAGVQGFKCSVQSEPYIVLLYRFIHQIYLFFVKIFSVNMTF